MRSEDILKALNEVGDRYILEAEPKAIRRMTWKKVLPMAAAVCLLCAAGAITWNRYGIGTKNSAKTGARTDVCLEETLEELLVNQEAFSYKDSEKSVTDKIIIGGARRKGSNASGASAALEKTGEMDGEAENCSSTEPYADTLEIRKEGKDLTFVVKCVTLDRDLEFLYLCMGGMDFRIENERGEELEQRVKLEKNSEYLLTIRQTSAEGREVTEADLGELILLDGDLQVFRTFVSSGKAE